MVRTGTAIVAALIAWGVYTVGLFPALDRVAAVEVNEPAVAAEQTTTNVRPRLNICFRLGDWAEDPECSAFGGYDENWSQLCSENAACWERMVLHQQTCVDRPAACYRFLVARATKSGSSPEVRRNSSQPEHQAFR
jgi:hypothetical protein